MDENRIFPGMDGTENNKPDEERKEETFISSESGSEINQTKEERPSNFGTPLQGTYAQFYQRQQFTASPSGFGQQSSQPRSSQQPTDQGTASGGAAPGVGQNPYGNMGPQSSYYNRPPYTYNGGYNYNANPYPAVQPPVKKQKNPDTWKIWVAVLCILCFSVSVIAGAVYSSRYLGKRIDEGTFKFPGTTTSAEEGVQKPIQNSSYESVADIAEDVGKSVVTIITAVSMTEGFFSVDAEALGSGIIIGEQGDKIYIATNYHVIEDASAVSVIVGDDETKAISAYHQGSDEDSDLAVIYIRKTDIPEDILKEIKIATLGSSSTLRLGDLAIAIGSPVDKSFGNTVTVGTISGLERSVTFTDDDNVSSTLILLQTDAAINPGNSGGALVNGRGEVIGVNNAKIVDTDVERIGFAIPIDTAKPILETLINEGKIVRPFLGIVGYNVADSQQLQQYRLLTGIYIQQVTPGGPADRAGIETNDIIVGFNGRTINTFDDLKEELEQCTIGQRVKIEVLRGYLEGEPHTEELEIVIQDKNA